MTNDFDTINTVKRDIERYLSEFEEKSRIRKTYNILMEQLKNRTNSLMILILLI